MFDVVVVGGNISGLSAAISASESGVSTAVIERYSKPLYPPRCGEGTDNITWSLFGVDECSRNEIKRIKVNVAESWSDVFQLRRFRLFIFDRYCVENRLLSKAESLGVKLFLGRRMKDFYPPYKVILDRGDIVEGKIIVDATGISCQIGRRLGVTPPLKSVDIGRCIQSRVEASFDKQMVSLWFHKPFAPFGYAWVFPFSKNLANIGIGIPGVYRLDLRNTLEKFISYATSGNSVVKSTFYACVPTALPIPRLVKGNVMIVGDAARLVNPVFGKGISNALLSGIVAGRVAAKYIQGEVSSLDLYHKLMRKKISSIKRFYRRKMSSLKSEDVFIQKYRKAFSLLKKLHSFAPVFLENKVIKSLKKDLSILEKLK